MNHKQVLIFDLTVIGIVSLIFLALAVITHQVHAETNGTIPIMSYDQREQVFQRVPNFQGSNINYYFEIVITPTGAQEKNLVLDQKNYTALKNNVGFFTACGGFNNGLCEPPVVVQSQPTMNYCPLAKMILTNQDGYLNKTYTVATNGTIIKDLTDFIYPSYCYTETGPNPINGHNIPAVPEFSILSLALVAGISSAIVITARIKKCLS